MRGAPVERAPNLWLPGQHATEGKGAPRQGKGRQTSGFPGSTPRREKVHRAWGRPRTNAWLPGPLAAERKGAQHPGRGRPNLWPPGLLVTGGKGAPDLGKGCQNCWPPGQKDRKSVV